MLFTTWTLVEEPLALPEISTLVTAKAVGIETLPRSAKEDTISPDLKKTFGRLTLISLTQTTTKVKKNLVKYR